jgi:hypothetical protein
MSAEVHAVAAAVVASPLPSPQVIKEVFNNTVPANVPDVVVQAAQIAGLFVAGLIISAAHRIIEYVTAKEQGWGPKVNTLLASLYTVGVGLVGAVTMHQFGASVAGIVALVLNSGVASIGTFWSYAIHSKLIASLLGGTTSSAPVVAALATENDPANGVG